MAAARQGDVLGATLHTRGPRAYPGPAHEERPAMSAAKLVMTMTLAAAIAAGAAQAQPGTRPAPTQCILVRNINSFNAPNDRTVYVRVGVKDFYRLDLMNDCTGITFGNSLALESSPGRSWICSPLEATVINRRIGMNQRCPVSAIHKLTADEAAALPKRDRP
jgi:hypothetical protein